MSEAVKSYYDNFIEGEWDRLQTSWSRLEFESTLGLIEKYFPVTGKIADIGSGPGRYAIACLEKGYEVTLYELSEGLIAKAKTEIEKLGLKAEAYINDDARNLHQLSGDHFDAVLLLGPLYHIIDKAERIAVLKNVHRILKKGGTAIVAYLNAWGVLKAGINEFPERYSDPAYLNTFLAEATFPESIEGFTECYFTTPQAATVEIEQAGLNIISYAGCESFCGGMKTQLENIHANNKPAYENILQTVLATCELAQFRDTTEHLVFVLRK